MPVKFPATIGPQFVRKVMPWVEQMWHAKGRYPLPDEFGQRFGFTLEQVKLMNHSKFWKDALARRGIEINPVALDEKQIAAISLITNFSDRRSIPVKMMAIDVTPEQLDGWYRNPLFKQELAARTDSVLEVSHPEVQASLIRQIQNGNFNATKFYFEITGRAQSQETVNLRLAMQRMLEIIQKHVQDPEVLSAIAQEILQSQQTAGELVSGN